MICITPANIASNQYGKDGGELYIGKRSGNAIMLDRANELKLITNAIIVVMNDI